MHYHDGTNITSSGQNFGSNSRQSAISEMEKDSGSEPAFAQLWAQVAADKSDSVEPASNKVDQDDGGINSPLSAGEPTDIAETYDRNILFSSSENPQIATARPDHFLKEGNLGGEGRQAQTVSLAAPPSFAPGDNSLFEFGTTIVTPATISFSAETLNNSTDFALDGVNSSSGPSSSSGAIALTQPTVTRTKIDSPQDISTPNAGSVSSTTAKLATSLTPMTGMTAADPVTGHSDARIAARPAQIVLPRTASNTTHALLQMLGQDVSSKTSGVMGAALQSDLLADRFARLPDEPAHDLILPSVAGTPAQIGRSSPLLLASATHAPQIASQIATAVIQSKSGTTEIALNPEELGRVRMTLTTTEAGMSVTILADRPETVDLMRKHIHLLSREFQDLGHENLSFSFGDDPANQHRSSDQPRSSNSGSQDTIATQEPATTYITATLSGGLNLKL